MRIGKIRIYSLSVNKSKQIFESEIFEITGFKENEDASAFDIEIDGVHMIKFYGRNLAIEAENKHRIILFREDYKEIIIP